MKINFVIPFTGSTGGIRVVYEYCNRLKANGHDVLIYSPMKAYKFNNDYSILGRLKTFKATLGNIFKRGNKVEWFDLKVDIKLVPKISNKYIRNADVTIATAWPTAYDVDKLSSEKGKKIYFIQHYETWSGPIDEVDGSYRLNLNQIVIAKWLKILMKEKFSKESLLLYNGIEDEMFLNNTKKINNNITCCILYNSLEWKGFHDGLKAFKIAKSKFKNIRLKVFGLEDLEESLGEGIEYYQNPKREQLKNIYEDSDIYIFPSKKEGWGLTVIEAMANKCTVVGTDTGSIEEVGINRINCLKSTPNNVEKLAENLIYSIEHEEIRNLISSNGYELALNFKWKESLSKLESYLQDLVKNK